VVELTPPFKMRLPARPGRHVLEAYLPGARKAAAVTTFTVHGGTE